jgi:acetyl-CoA carboxylase biotin carboxyl carrier protein
MTIKPQDIATLVEMFEASQWDELHVELEGLQLFLSTDPNARLANSRNGAHVPEARVSPPPPPAGAAAAATARATPASHSEGNEATPSAGDVPANWIAVTAPNLGTFYRAPKPGAAPFVEVGQAVEASIDVCLLEVMKLFTTVKAGTKGIIRRVCANDSDMVEFGQTLFYIDPN